ETRAKLRVEAALDGRGVEPDLGGPGGIDVEPNLDVLGGRLAGQPQSEAECHDAAGDHVDSRDNPIRVPTGRALRLALALHSTLPRRLRAPRRLERGDLRTPLGVH